MRYPKSFAAPDCAEQEASAERDRGKQEHTTIVHRGTLWLMSHDGMIVGSPTFAAAKFGLGLTAVSDSNYISLPTGTFSMTSGSSWAIDAWVKTSTASILFILSSANTGDPNAMYSFTLPSGNFAFFVPGTGAFAGNLDSGIAITDNAWHHVAVSMNGGTTLKIFVDGIQGGGDFVGAAANPITTHTGGYLGRWTLADGFAWAGAIDELAIWSVNEFTTNFTPPSAPYTGSEIGLFALYHLEGDATDSAASRTTVLMNDAGILYSPYNWNVSASWAKTINSGAYLKTIFYLTSVGLLTDTSTDGPPYSQFWVRIDGQGWTQYVLSAGDPTILVASNLPSRKHLLELILKSTTQDQSRWVSGGTTLTITGLSLDSGGFLTAPLARTKRILMYGDSITEAARDINATAPNDTDRDDSLGGYAYQVANAADAEVGIVAFGAQGVTVPGAPDVPTFPDSYNLIYDGVPRVFSPAPDLVIYNFGTNDGSNNITPGLTTVANEILAICPASIQMMLVPFDGTHAAEVVAAAAAVGSQAVSIDTTGWFNPIDSPDGGHPYSYAHIGFIAPRLFPLVAAQLYPSTVIPPIVPTGAAPLSQETATLLQPSSYTASEVDS